MGLLVSEDLNPIHWELESKDTKCITGTSMSPCRKTPWRSSYAKSTKQSTPPLSTFLPPCVLSTDWILKCPLFSVCTTFSVGVLNCLQNVMSSAEEWMGEDRRSRFSALSALSPFWVVWGAGCHLSLAHRSPTLWVQSHRTLPASLSPVPASGSPHCAPECSGWRKQPTGLWLEQ